MKFVAYEREGAIAIIRLNRPERGNSLGDEMVSDLMEASEAFAHDKEVRVGILTGTGRFFCTGMDLKQWAETQNPFIHPGFKEVLNPEKILKPVIGAINGWAVAGGMIMALERCDLLVMAEDAIMAMYEIKRGTPAGSRLRLTFNLPPSVAAEIVYGFDIPARRALEMGLVNRVVPPERLMESAVQMAEHLVSLPPQAVSAAKEALTRARPPIPRDFEDFYQERILSLFRSTESLNLARDFAKSQKKKP